MRVRDPERLRQARIDAGYSQRNLAALAYCTQATISGLETGSLGSTSLDLAVTIARWLRVDVDTLFDDPEPGKTERKTRQLNALGSRRS